MAVAAACFRAKTGRATHSRRRADRPGARRVPGSGAGVRGGGPGCRARHLRDGPGKVGESTDNAPRHRVQRWPSGGGRSRRRGVPPRGVRGRPAQRRQRRRGAFALLVDELHPAQKRRGELTQPRRAARRSARRGPCGRPASSSPDRTGPRAVWPATRRRQRRDPAGGHRPGDGRIVLPAVQVGRRPRRSRRTAGSWTPARSGWSCRPERTTLCA